MITQVERTDVVLSEAAAAIRAVPRTVRRHDRRSITNARAVWIAAIHWSLAMTTTRGRTRDVSIRCH
jgi:hypothetical protein